MTFSLQEKADEETLKAKVLQEKGLEGCQAILFATTDEKKTTETPESNIFVITAFGKDSEGIVSQFTRYLGDKEINIVDLYGDITPEGDFVLIGQVEVDPKLDLQNIKYDLEALGEQVGFTVRIQHNNIFVATNHIRLNRR